LAHQFQVLELCVYLGHEKGLFMYVHSNIVPKALGQFLVIMTRVFEPASMYATCDLVPRISIRKVYHEQVYVVVLTTSVFVPTSWNVRCEIVPITMRVLRPSSWTCSTDTNIANTLVAIMMHVLELALYTLVAVMKIDLVPNDLNAFALAHPFHALELCVYLDHRKVCATLCPGM